MRTLIRFLLLLILIAGIALGGAWFWGGRAEGPAITIVQPERFVGQATTLQVTVETPGGDLSDLDVAVEQGDRRFTVASMTAAAGTALTQESADRVSLSQPIGKVAIPELASGPARIVVRASRPVMYGLRQATSSVEKDIEVRLEPPRVSVLSTKHYVNLGGAEFVAYRATPEDVTSGVKVGDIEFPGFPASGAGIQGDPALRVAVFALAYDQDLTTPISVFARDEAGNEAATAVGHEAFPKPFARSRITVDDSFFARVLPEIVSNTPGLDLSTAPDDLLDTYLAVNGDLRRRNADTIRELAGDTAPAMLWKGAFNQLGNSQVESRFADHRTYFYDGREVDRQVHLGFDLAVTANVAVTAAERGRVVFAAYLGIYGNCVILDHGLGVQSLYAHLSSIDVTAGAEVEKGQVLGRSGMTGLAGGDHLHFTMLVNGYAVNPVEWWDPKWMQDRILRKIAEAGGAPGGSRP
ncbi:MAG: M23 family metallopeptidase [Acidimicrobiia bacterium]|nr:M23 family metallopeptidase [Acidimicrobiia bacterium]